MSESFIVMVQARMGSSRLPGKVLLPMGDTTVLGVLLRKLNRAGIDTMVVAPDTPDSCAIKAEALKHGVETNFSSAENDVLSRYYFSSFKVKQNTIIRITADCPLINIDLLKYGMEEHIVFGSAFTSNVINRTFPKGWDFEIVTKHFFRDIFPKIEESYDKEHVTSYIYKNLSDFDSGDIHSIEQKRDDSNINLSIDTLDDYIRVRGIYESCQ